MKPASYLALEAELQAIGIPCAEKGWTTRPADEYITYDLEFEAGSDAGDGRKTARAWEGSVDYFSRDKNSSVVDEIETALEKTTGSCWRCEQNGAWERATGLFRWEWVFQVEDAAPAGE